MHRLTICFKSPPSFQPNSKLQLAAQSSAAVMVWRLPSLKGDLRNTGDRIYGTLPKLLLSIFVDSLSKSRLMHSIDEVSDALYVHLVYLFLFIRFLCESHVCKPSARQLMSLQCLIFPLSHNPHSTGSWRSTPCPYTGHGLRALQQSPPLWTSGASCS